MPLDISEFSRRYNVRRMYESDADTILALCRKNTQYYAYCGKNPSKELIFPPSITSGFTSGRN